MTTGASIPLSAGLGIPVPGRVLPRTAGADGGRPVARFSDVVDGALSPVGSGAGRPRRGSDHDAGPTHGAALDGPRPSQAAHPQATRAARAGASAAAPGESSRPAEVDGADDPQSTADTAVGHDDAAVEEHAKRAAASETAGAEATHAAAAPHLGEWGTAPGSAAAGPGDAATDGSVTGRDSQAGSAGQARAGSGFAEPPASGLTTVKPGMPQGGRLGSAPGQPPSENHGAVAVAPDASAAAETGDAGITTPVFDADAAADAEEADTDDPSALNPQGEKAARAPAAAASPSAAVVAAEATSDAGGPFADVEDQGQRKPSLQNQSTAAGTVTPGVTPADAGRMSLGASQAGALYGGTPAGRGEVVLPQIVQAIRVQTMQGVSEARVQLAPEHLGAVSITLRVEHGQVSATINAEVPAVRQWIEAHESSLRQALQEQGLQLQKLVVHRDGEAPSREQPSADDSQGRQRRRAWRDETATFELIA